MAEMSNPDLMALVLTVSHKMLGTSIDVEEMFEEYELPWGYHQAPPMFFVFLDRKVWKCEECDHWCEPGELNNDDICMSCVSG